MADKSLKDLERQNEKITKDNYKRKNIEIVNRTNSLLNKYNGYDLYYS